MSWAVALRQGQFSTSKAIPVVTAPGPVGPLLADGQAYANQQRGVFLCYNMSTFVGSEFANAFEDPDTFNPTALNIGQWLDVCVEFGAEYAVFTVKHSDGFCLWPTTTTIHNVSNSSWYVANANADPTQIFVDECRSHNIRPVLYFSNDDRNWFGSNPGYTAAAFAAFQEAQMQELFTRYGPIAAVWLDSTYWYFSSWFPWTTSSERNAIVKSFQPGIIVVDNNHTATLADSDVVEYESGLVPGGNTDPCETCSSVGGPMAWFWKSDTMPLADAGTIGEQIRHLNVNNGTYLCGFPPNPTGIIPDQQVKLMRQIKMYLGESPKVSPDNMTSNTAPSPYVASASHEVATLEAWNAFNFSLPYTDAWSATGLPSWIQIDLGAPATASTYMVLATQSGVYNQWMSWTLAGSNDGSSWTTLSTVNETAYVNPGVTRFYDLASPQTYRYWRWTVTASVNGTGADCKFLALYGDSSLELVSVAQATVTVTGQTVMLALEIISITKATVIATGQTVTSGDTSTGPDAATDAWEAAVISAGGTVSGTRKTAVDTLIKGLKTDGVWPLLDRLWVLAADNAQSAKIDLKGLITVSIGGSPTFTANLGYTCTGGTGYVNTLFIPSTDGVNYTLNSAHHSIWNLTDGQSTAAAAATTNYSAIIPRYTDDNAYLWVNYNSGGGYVNADARGFIVANRKDSSTVQGYKNGVSMGADTTVGAITLDTTAWVLLNRQIAASSLGGHLTAAQQLALYNRLRTYMNGTLVP